MKRNLLPLGAAGLVMLLASLATLSAAHLTGLTLFGVSELRNELVTINPATGAGRIVGPLGENIAATGLAARDGRLFAFDQVNDRIREINKVTGELTSSIDIGVGNLNGEGALAFRPSDRVGFLASPLNANREPTNDFFTFTIEPTTGTGASTRLGSTGVAIDAMAFNSQGQLYAIGQEDATLYTIDPTTGAATAVGPITLAGSAVAKNSPIAGMTFGTPNPDMGNVEEIYAAIDDRLLIITPSTGAARLGPGPNPEINFGPFVSSVSGLAFTPGAATLGNLSSRVAVGTDANAGFGGFIVRGSPGKQVVLRGIGPSITSVSTPLADPVIELFDSQGVSIARNDNYKDSPEAAQIQAAGLSPSRDSESAILRTLNEGNYTVVLSGAGNTSGIGLVEIYDIDAGNGSRLANISTRGQVQSGDDILIGGMIVIGSTSQRVVTRAIGPDLAATGVPSPLQDPTLDVRDANGTSLGTNDNFGTGGQTDELAQNNLTPGDSRDSAIILNFAPGNYTAVVTGAGGATGIALVEFYNLSTNNQ